ncbi:MAG: SDR family oxidoreductase [Desulfobacteraceae bacterium]|nr:SDR family oxidoreductase [Desulfobacteraceae bacterium]
MTKKTIYITGASSGFGAACARRFAREGWRLVLTGRRRGHLERLRDELKADCQLLVQDVRDRERIAADLAALPEGFREIEVLVNNAGLALGMGPAPEADLDQWETMIDTNIKGLVYCTRLILPGMVARGRGHIVNIGSVAGNWPYPGGNVYGSSKAFVKQFSLNLRADLLGTGVRVSNVEPGLAETEFSLVRFGGDRDKADAVYDRTQPLTGEDIADIVFWLVSQPPHVNINRVEVMPVCQSCGPFAIHRRA